MSPEQIPIPLEKKVEIKNGVVEVSIAEMTMTDKEKKVYQKFMAKCVAASPRSEKDAMVACAVDFKKMKDQLMAEEDEEEDDEEEDDIEEMKKEAEEEEKEEEEEEEGKTVEEKIKLEEEDIKEDQKYLKELKKKAESAVKKQGKMEYREKPKTSANSVGIITVEQINKWEKEEKNENRLDELKETKFVWKNTVDL
jgi:hypothetical protein